VRRYADPVATLPARFAAKVDKTGDCWKWTGARNATGYGHISAGRGVCLMAHRVSWELHRGPIPDGHQIDHLCRNPGCVNPDHLEPVTPALNTARSWGPAALNAEKECCIRGHDLDGPNLRWERGKRVCRECRNVRQRAARARVRAEQPGGDR
jgi:HNH endonuclease